LCSLKTTRRVYVIRHIREKHGVEDPNAQNATKDSNTRVTSNGKDKTTKVSKQLRIMSAGIPLSEEIYSSMDSPEKMTSLQDGGGELHRRQARMEPDCSEDEEDEPGINPVDGLYSREEIEKFGEDLTRKKCHILDCVLDTFPEHLKAEAKSMCDVLKCKDRFFILPSHEMILDGEVDRGSNVRDYIMDSLIEPPLPGTPKFRMLEGENERLKRNLAYYEKALARAQGMSRCRKFESIIDGTVDRCDFSDDTDSSEDNDEDDYTDGSEDNDEDGDRSEDNDEDDYTDGTEEDDEKEDMDENEYYEPTKKRKKKN
jgi:hypothetical protein